MLNREQILNNFNDLALINVNSELSVTVVYEVGLFLDILRRVAAECFVFITVRILEYQ